MRDDVVIDEWTVVLVGRSSLPEAVADELRRLVVRELAALTTRVNALLAPTATVRVAAGLDQ